MPICAVYWRINQKVGDVMSLQDEKKQAAAAALKHKMAFWVLGLEVP